MDTDNLAAAIEKHNKVELIYTSSMDRCTNVFSKNGDTYTMDWEMEGFEKGSSPGLTIVDVFDEVFMIAGTCDTPIEEVIEKLAKDGFIDFELGE